VSNSIISTQDRMAAERILNMGRHVSVETHMAVVEAWAEASGDTLRRAASGVLFATVVGGLYAKGNKSSNPHPPDVLMSEENLSSIRKAKRIPYVAYPGDKERGKCSCGSWLYNKPFGAKHWRCMNCGKIRRGGGD